MDASALVPPAHALPGPVWLLQALSLGAFTAHLLIVNLVWGAAIVLLLESFGAQELRRGELKKLPPLMALVVNLAVPPLIFLQVMYGPLTFVTGVLMGGTGLALAALVLSAYGGLYGVTMTDGNGTRQALLALVAAAMAGVAFLQVNHMTLMLSPERWTAWFEAPGSLMNYGEPTLWPRYVHMLAASVAVAGLGLALLRQRRGDDEGAARAKGYFVGGTVVQMASGMIFLFSLPDEIRMAFMGGDVMASAGVWGGAALAGAALWLCTEDRFAPAGACVLGAVGLMVLARDALRRLTLQDHFDLQSLAERSDVGGMILFGGSVLLAAALVGALLAMNQNRETDAAEQEA